MAQKLLKHINTEPYFVYERFVLSHGDSIDMIFTCPLLDEYYNKRKRS